MKSLQYLTVIVTILWFVSAVGSRVEAQPVPGVGPNPVTDIYGHMGVGTVSPDISAVLDLASAHAGLLIPRMSVAARDAIYRPASSLLIFNLGSQQFEYNAGAPLTPHWIPFLSSLTLNEYGWLLTGNTGTNPATDFLGTNDTRPLIFRTNGVERMRLTEGGTLGVGTPNPDPSAVADFSSTSGGVLIPRVTTAQRDGISLPASGLLVFNMSANRFEYNAGTPQSVNWVGLGEGPRSGSRSIPVNATTLFVPDPLITASSHVVISVFDTSGQTINATVSSITPGAGFLVAFAGFYPTSTGSIAYMVVD